MGKVATQATLQLVATQATLQQVAKEATLQRAVDLLQVVAGGTFITNPSTIQDICTQKKARDHFTIGQIIKIPWTDKGVQPEVTYDIPFVVAHFGTVTDALGIEHKNAMYLMSMYGLFQYKIPFDNAEMTLMDGSNRWSQSALRQWLNSDAAANQWWSAQSAEDVAPANIDFPGFLTGFSDEWREIFKPIQVKTQVQISTEVDTTLDTFFIPSSTEVYGNQSAAIYNGAPWEYWIQETGLTEGINGSLEDTNRARQILLFNNFQAGPIRIRLRNPSNSTQLLGFYANGYIGTPGTPSNTVAFQPTTVIY